MPLRSPLFSGNTKLQNCLASHAAHVGPGARGRHVALIQSALVRLRVLDAADAREEAGRYGTRISSQLTSMRALASLMATAFGGIETVPIFPVQ